MLLVKFKLSLVFALGRWGFIIDLKEDIKRHFLVPVESDISLNNIFYSLTLLDLPKTFFFLFVPYDNTMG